MNILRTLSVVLSSLKSSMPSLVDGFRWDQIPRRSAFGGLTYSVSGGMTARRLREGNGAQGNGTFRLEIASTMSCRETVESFSNHMLDPS